MESSESGEDGLMRDANEISLQDQLALVRRHAKLTVAIMLLAGVLGWLAASTRPDEFLGTARLLSTQPDPAIAELSTSVATARPLDGAAYRAVALSRPLAEAATDAIAEATPANSSPEDLLERLTVVTTEARLSTQITIAVRARGPESAAAQANAVADELVAWDASRSAEAVARLAQALQRQIENLDEQLVDYEAAGDTAMVNMLTSMRSEAERGLSATRLAATTIAGNLELIEPAIAPVEPEPKRALLLGLLAALIAGLGVVLVVLYREAASSLFRGVDDVARASRLPVLGVFPIDPSGSRRLPPEAASYVRSNLQFLVPPDHPLVVLVTSGVAGEGKTSMAIALAEAYARDGYRTALVDADGRHPRLAQTLRLTGAGVRSWFVEGEAVPDTSVLVPLERGRSYELFALTESLGNDGRQISRAFGRLSEHLKDGYDVVIVDSAPILPVADTLGLAPQASAVVVVASLREATRDSLRSTLGVLDRVGANVAGVAVTHVPRELGRRGYGYGYGYGTEPEGTKKGHAASARPRNERAGGRRTSSSTGA